VEDSPTDAGLIQAALSELSERVEIRHVERMEAAEECLGEAAPLDAVLLDLGLPDSTGLATLERANRAAPHLPIIVLTGLEDEPLGVEAARKGAQDYLVKGQTNPRRLLQSIHHAVERKHLANALQESQERLALALGAGQIGLFAWNVPQGEFVGTLQTELLLGYAPTATATTTAEPRSYRDWAEVVHPDDLPWVEERLNSSMAVRTPFEAEYRVVWPDGSLHWIVARGQFSYDAEGRATRLLGTVMDVTERKRAEEALATAKAAAEAANEAKSRFLANVSHELRTPMNAILGMVDLALPRQMDAAARGFLQTVKESADLLLALLNDLLDCARIESGKLELEAAPFSLLRVLDQTTRVFAVRASERGITFSCRIPADLPDVLIGDQVRLRQILFNLAGNAIKFTERGEVTVSVRVESQSAAEACLEFAMRDTGIGIPPADLQRIFQPFTQAAEAATQRFGGTGLGLTIASNLVAMMGGRIWVESEPGQGSTFYFTVRLPVSKEPLPEAVETTPSLPALPAVPLRVLLVEDNPANQKLTAYILQERGHRVAVASDGRQALGMLQENQYDLVLMDVQMPGMDGLETTAVIRAREAGKTRVPIIAMTAHAMKGDRERCLAGGMDGYLSKPIDAREMISLVESLAEGRAEGTGIRGQESGVRGQESGAGGTFINHQSSIINPTAVLFDPEQAIKRCFNSRKMFGEMVEFFLNEVDHLLLEMHAAVEQGDLPEVGRLGHRLKGTVVYLAAEPATQAGLRVERFDLEGGEQAEAKAAVRALQRECEVLKAALAPHRPATCQPPQE
jgi:signal transduction histidine kinase/BarA-like signal transduction histidine kinase